MTFRYICPHCQGDGNKFGFKLLSFIKCKVCNGEGYIYVSDYLKSDKTEKDTQNVEQPTKEESPL